MHVGLAMRVAHASLMLGLRVLVLMLRGRVLAFLVLPGMLIFAVTDIGMLIAVLVRFPHAAFACRQEREARRPATAR